MKIYKSDKYKNYGPSPRNEYTTSYVKNNENSAATSELDAQADDTTQTKSLRKPRLQYPPNSGWKQSGKANGWRAEIASRQDESIETRRYYNYVVNKPTPIGKRRTMNGPLKKTGNESMTLASFITEEVSLICICKAETRRGTLCNMLVARIYINDPDMLVDLDNAANKLDNMTDIDFSGIVFDKTCKKEIMAQRVDSVYLCSERDFS